jgi:hypothetical protein
MNAKEFGMRYDFKIPPNNCCDNCLHGDDSTITEKNNSMICKEMLRMEIEDARTWPNHVCTLYAR